MDMTVFHSRINLLLIATLLLVGCGSVLSQKWVQSSEGRIPDHAFEGGTDVDGSILYICKASYQGEMCVGKVNTHLGNCRIPFFGSEHMISPYEVLTLPPLENYSLAWTGHDYRNGALPQNPVIVDPKGIYVGRYRKDGHYIPGKIVTFRDSFYYGYNQKEHQTENYQVLCKIHRSIDRYEVYNVRYNLNQVAYDLSNERMPLAQEFVLNDSPHDTTSLISMNFRYKNTSEWSLTAGFEVYAGIQITVTAGLPIFVDSSSSTGVILGASTSTSYTYGGANETFSDIITSEPKVNLPAYSNVSVSILAKRRTGNIPFNGTLRVVYTNNESYNQIDVEGIFKGAHSTSFETSIKSAPLVAGRNEGIKTVYTYSLSLTVTSVTVFAINF